MSGMNAENATLSIGDKFAGFSPVSKKSQQASSTFTAVSGESCLTSSRRSSFILNQLGCLSLPFAIAAPHATVKRRLVLDLVKRSASSGMAFLNAVLSNRVLVTVFHVI